MSNDNGPWTRPPGRRGPHPLLLWLALAGGGALVLWLFATLTGAGPQSRDGWLRATYLLLILSVILTSAIVSRHRRLGTAIKQAGLWLLIAAAILLGYSYRYELRSVGERMLGTLMPHSAITTASGDVVIQRGRDGHFHVEAKVNGATVRFLIDTGATSIVLSQADAKRAGLRPDSLAYTQIASTANGLVQTAPVRLQRIEVGDIAFEEIPATVNGGELDNSLLGMHFLNRLNGFSFEGDRLTLRP